MKNERIKEILAAINSINVVVYADFCLDAYWMLDPRGSEVSVETGLKGFAVGKQKYSLGGASNIVANLAALKPLSIQAIGVIGDDIFDRELVRQLQVLGVNTTKLLIQKENFDTVTYCKQYLEDNEQPRIDFGIFNQRPMTTDKTLIEILHEVMNQTDVLVINQQVPGSGSMNKELFIDGLNVLIEKFPKKIVLLDSRPYGQYFQSVYRKTNDFEATHLNDVYVSTHEIIALSDVKHYIDKLYRQSNKTVFSSRGGRGILVRDERGFHEIPGIQILNKIDPVGAGDTLLSALACCLAAGCKTFEAAEFENFAAAVTVQKLFLTGTASPQEIIMIASDPDYVYQPELAEDIRQASYLQTSEIEVCCELQALKLGAIKHITFDHDGTISVLRQGWETIMEQVMIKAILGDEYDSADESLYHKVRHRVIDYIDKSTGIQTILQMEALVEMVKEFHIVPQENVLDKFEYKEVYNSALMEMVRRRISKLESGEFVVDDYTIKGAFSFLKSLQEKEITLYLASGTDKDDVIAEARTMGYDKFFNGGIYGAVGDVKKYSKKKVIEETLHKNKLQAPEFVCFGDGPVEIRECRKHDGITIGIASDDIRRHGLNSKKKVHGLLRHVHISLCLISLKLIKLLSYYLGKFRFMELCRMVKSERICS